MQLHATKEPIIYPIMILLEDIETDPNGNDRPAPHSNNEELIFLEHEKKYVAIAKEYKAMKKRPFCLTEQHYEMSACKYDVKERVALEKLRKGYVELTDAQYVFLLIKVLTYGSSYRYPHLLRDSPELARKIIEQLYGYYEEGAIGGWGYYVIFDEIFENAKEIMQLKDYYMPGSPNRTMILF